MAAIASISAFLPALSCCCSCFAACELSLSSIICTGNRERPSSCCANFRAALVISESLPSACSGRPTTRASGCHSSINSRILSQSGCSLRAFTVHRAVAVPVILCPTAIPVRCVPKSNPSSVCKTILFVLFGRVANNKDSSGMSGVAGQEVEIDSQQCSCCLPAFLAGCLKYDL